MKTNVFHIPVLLRESIAGLAIKPGGIYVDLTYGGGGHSAEILKRLEQGRLIAFDQDPAVKEHLIEDARLEFIDHNYRYLKNFLEYKGVTGVDGILADLGVSSHHLDAPERGFSFRFDAPLDMRMNQESSRSAKGIVNDYPEEELVRIIKQYGEMERPMSWAKAICTARSIHVIESTKELVDAVKGLLKRGKEHKDLARLFQALRIEVNQEIDGLKEMLMQCIDLLKPGGRLVIISYHSLEDRLVKNIIRSGNPQGIIQKDFYGNLTGPFKMINRKIIEARPEEMEQNPRARSAKLRIAERLK